MENPFCTLLSSAEVVSLYWSVAGLGVPAWMASRRQQGWDALGDLKAFISYYSFDQLPS